MGEGAVLSDIVNREDKYAGAVDVKGGGYAKIEAGSTATRLSNITDSSFGGFLCLEPEAKCEIAGGAVNACFARGSGGAIYVARNAELLISGPAYINGNTVSSENIPSDIFLASGSSLSVASVLNEGSFGVTMPTGKTMPEFFSPQIWFPARRPMKSAKRAKDSSTTMTIICTAFPRMIIFRSFGQGTLKRCIILLTKTTCVQRSR